VIPEKSPPESGGVCPERNAPRSDSGAASEAADADISANSRRMRARLWRRDRWRIILVCSLIPPLALAGYLEYPYLRAEYHFRSADRARLRRDFAAARRHLMLNLSADWRSARDHFLLARICRQTASFDEADEHLQECEKWEGASARLALERALLQVQQGGISRSMEEQLRTHIAEGRPETPEILEALSAGCLMSYRFGAAEAYLTKWLELLPDNSQAYIWRSLARERLLGFADARDDARHAVALAPDSFEGRLRLAQSLLFTTEYQEAAELFATLSRERPGSPLAGMGLAQASAKLGRFEEAAAALDALLARYPTDAPVLLERGRLALLTGDNEHAESWLRQAAAAAPWDYQINYSLLQVLRQRGKSPEAGEIESCVRRIQQDNAALRKLNEAFRSNPYDLSIRCDIARILLAQGNAKEALDWLTAALKVEPTYPLANRMLADYYDKIGEARQAALYRAAAGR
jgi:Flp pilus assembly protein TadD